MFEYTIDDKEQITDRNGNTIVDLTKSVFSRSAEAVKDYEVLKMDAHYNMRPDLVSYAVYEDDRFAEFILKFSGVSNPFTLGEDDVLLIPNDAQAEGMMAYNSGDEENDERTAVATQIRNYFKFVNQEYKSDSTSYDRLAQKDIPSGVIDTSKKKDWIVPYISEDGRTAVTVRNGRMYFGEDAGVPIANEQSTTSEGVAKSVQSIIDSAVTSLSDSNCLYNGTTLADFVRSNYNNGSGGSGQ